MYPVQSSSIEAVGYDEATLKLYVKFLESGETYVYDGVRREVFVEFMLAESKGHYFNSQIRKRYRYERL